MASIGRALTALLSVAALSVVVSMRTQAQDPVGDAMQAHVSVDSLFEAAARGELGPVRALKATTSPELRALLNARLAAARLDPEIADDPALKRLAASGDPALRQAALSVLTDATFANGDYAAAARFGQALETALAGRGKANDAADAGQTWRLAALLAGYPAQAVAGSVRPTTIPAWNDRLGLPRIGIEVNGVVQDAVFDTGANLSVLSAEAARRTGVKVLDADAKVGNGVGSTVPVRVGIAERIEIAGTVLNNVPFLIIADADLTFPVPGGYEIRAIIGLPMMRALGRVRVESGAGRFTVLPAGRATGPANLHASGNNVFVDTIVGGQSVPLHLDTGANHTTLSALYAKANPAAVTTLAIGSARSASAGGTRESRIATWADAPLLLAGRALVLPELRVALADGNEAERFYGTLGSDALGAFESYTIDFVTMRLDLGEPVRSSPRTTREAAAAGRD